MNSENTNYNTLSNSDEITLNELILKGQKWINYLFSRRLIILLFGIIGGVLGFTYAYLKKPIFTATTTFVLESGESGGGLGQYAGLASVVGIDIGGNSGGIFQGDNILELYKSRTMIEKTLLTEVECEGKHQLLVDRYIEFNKLRDKWAERPELKSIQFEPAKSSIENPNSLMISRSRLKDSILNDIINAINKSYLMVSKPDKKLSIIRVDVKSKDEFFAKYFNDKIVENVNDFYIQTKTKISLENVGILERKTDSVRKVMNGAIYTAAAVSDATPNLNPTRQIQRVAPIQRSQFSAETNKAVLTQLIQNLEISKMTLLKEKPLIQVVDQPIYPLEIERIGPVKGVVLGGLIGGILIVLFLSFKLMIKNISTRE